MKELEVLVMNIRFCDWRVWKWKEILLLFFMLIKLVVWMWKLNCRMERVWKRYIFFGFGVRVVVGSGGLVLNLLGL